MLMRFLCLVALTGILCLLLPMHVSHRDKILIKLYKQHDYSSVGSYYIGPHDATIRYCICDFIVCVTSRMF